MLESIIGPTISSIQAELEENFPPVNPHPKQNIGEVMYLAGQRSVVEWYNKRVSKDENWKDTAMAVTTYMASHPTFDTESTRP